MSLKYEILNDIHHVSGGNENTEISGAKYIKSEMSGTVHIYFVSVALWFDYVYLFKLCLIDLFIFSHQVNLSTATSRHTLCRGLFSFDTFC